MAIILLLLAACVDKKGSNEQTEAVLTGKFVDAAVEGLRFETASLSGKTDADGTFAYRKGEKISFFVGDVSLGKTTPADTLTPLDLVPGAVDENTPHVTNLLRFLQTPDEDGLPSNGIRISQSLHSALAGQELNFALDPASFEDRFNTLNSSVLGGRALVPATTARIHFRRTRDILAGGAGLGRLSFTLVGKNYAFDFIPRLAPTGFGNWMENAQGTGTQLAITRGASFSDLIKVEILGPYGFVLTCYPEPDPQCKDVEVDEENRRLVFDQLTVTVYTSGGIGSSELTPVELVVDGTLYW